MSEWVDTLAIQCKLKSQAAVASRLSVSASMINQALKGVYPSEKGLTRLRDLVEGAYMGRTVCCPILDDIPKDQCIEYQERHFAATNPLRVQLFKACRVCPHSKESKNEP